MTMSGRRLRSIKRFEAKPPDLDLPLSDLARDVAPIQEATDLRDLFAALAQSVLRTLRVDAVFVSLLDGERDVLIDYAASVGSQFKPNLLAEEYSLKDFPATRSVIDSGESLEISVSDPYADSAESRFLTEVGLSRALISRLNVEGRGIGVVEAFRINDRPFRKDDPHHVDLLVGFAANAYSRIRLAEKLESHYTETIEALVSALEARDPYTEAHTGRIRDLASALAVAMRLPANLRRAIRLGALMHDVGKIGIADSILRKPGPLDDAEWEQMRMHPEIGVRMLQKIEFLDGALPIIRSHHERWDGDGYPDGRAGEDIPIAARIITVCDAFDAMTSDRPYRTAMSVEAACDEIQRCAGTQFDPTCAMLLVEMVKNMGDTKGLEARFVRYAS
jgi:HD-GYP domain-containing protein (c-di-GMP phosphodiesterase class II)